MTLPWPSCYCTRLSHMPCPSYPSMPVRSELCHVPTPSPWPCGTVGDLGTPGTIRPGPRFQDGCPGPVSIPEGAPCPLPGRSTRPHVTMGGTTSPLYHGRHSALGYGNPHESTVSWLCRQGLKPPSQHCHRWLDVT